MQQRFMIIKTIQKRGLAFVLAVFFVVFAAACQTRPGVEGATETPDSSAPMPKVSQETLKTLLPETIGAGKQLIVDVYSKFCIACQQLAPKLETIAEKHPAITIKRIDIQRAEGSDKELVKTLQVLTVPSVTFISGDGEIKKIYQDDVPQSELEDSARLLLPKDIEQKS